MIKIFLWDKFDQTLTVPGVPSLKYYSSVCLIKEEVITYQSILLCLNGCFLDQGGVPPQSTRDLERKLRDARLPTDCILIFWKFSRTLGSTLFIGLKKTPELFTSQVVFIVDVKW